MLNPSPSRRQSSPFTQVPVRHAPVDLSGMTNVDFGAGFKAIGAGIEKYGLRKEQQKEELGEIKSGLDFLKQAKSKESRPEMKVYYDTAENFLEDQNNTSKERAAYTSNMFKHLTFGSQLERSQADTERIKQLNWLSQRTQDDDVKIKRMTAELAANNKFISDIEKLGSLEKAKDARKKRQSEQTRLDQDIEIARKQEDRDAAREPLRAAKDAADLLKVDAETKVLNKKLSGAGVDPNQLEPVMDENGNAVPNTFYNKSGGMVNVDTTDPKKPTVTTVTGTLEGAKAEARIRLEKGKDILGDMLVGKFEDYEGDDHKQPLSINQYVDVLDSGVLYKNELFDLQTEDEIHWTDGDKKKHRFDFAEFPKLEELPRRTNKSKPLEVGDRVDAYLKKREELAFLSDSEEVQSPVGEDEDLPEESLDEEINNLLGQ